jgi:hypothetical protein
MKELKFLKEKGLIAEGLTKFIIKGSFGEVELTELLKEYHAEQLNLYLDSDTNCDFNKAKVGEYLKCIKLYPQSRKYTLGHCYQIIKERDYNDGCLQIAIRDDHGKLTWISREHGVSYTEFDLKKILINNKPPAFNVVNSEMTEESIRDFIELIEPEKQ